MNTGITIIAIFVLFIRSAGALMGYRDSERRRLNACGRSATLHGMSAFMYAIDRGKQHDNEEKLGKEF